MFERQCARNYSLDDFLAIDETLHPTRESIGFKTYNNNKPAKYRLNFRSLGSAWKDYVYYTIPYCEKPEVIADAYIEDTLTLVKRIAKDTNKTIIFWGVPITMGRYYTPIPLAKWLYSKHITCTGTIQTNRKDYRKK